MSKEQQLPVVGGEIDLGALFLTLWRGRILIIACTITTICIASLYLHSAQRKYTVNYTFQPVADTGEGNQFNGISGLASLAGISTPAGGGGDFQTFSLLLQTEEVAEQLLAKREITREVFAAEWNNRTKQFEQPKLSATGQAFAIIKALLTGEAKQKYIPPNAARLSEWLSNAFTILEQSKTGFIQLTTETSNPLLIIEVMKVVTDATDKIIKDRFLSGGRQSVKFYQNEIAAARSRESRQALAQLIVSEQQKIMLASNGSFFVAKPLTSPSVSLHATSPKSSLVLGLAILLGGFFGTAIVLFRKVIKND